MWYDTHVIVVNSYLKRMYQLDKQNTTMWIKLLLDHSLTLDYVLIQLSQVVMILGQS